MKVGIKTGQGGYTYEELSRVWQKADELGFDSAWLYDHFIALGNPDSACLEAYTTLAALSRDTHRLRLGVVVTCAGYRSPGLLAKTGATLDVISGGCFLLGLGAGWYEAEYRSYGYSYLNNPERIEQLRETVEIVRQMWSRDQATYAGKHYTVEQAVSLPKPVQKYPPIWVGISRGTKVMPRLAVLQADGFNTTSDLEISRQIIAAAETEREKVGRERSTVTYSQQSFVLTGSESQIAEIARQAAQQTGVSPQEYVDALKKRGWLVGSPAECTEKLNAYLQAGIDYLVLGIAGDRLGWPLEVVRNELVPLLPGVGE
ncbi:MAG: LLM class flavin-dependent oxidoreductase [Chloroflexi bacterium]|nr:LLM class flavin-dependent oxidoreductase [Chloroflexota bacterium]